MELVTKAQQPDDAEEWSEEELVEFYVEKRWIEMRKVLDYLADRPGQQVSGPELAKHLGMSGKQFSGVMRGAVHPRRPFETRYDSETGQTVYVLPRREAKALRMIRLILKVTTRLRLSLS